MDELIKNVKIWAKEKNLLHKENSQLLNAKSFRRSWGDGLSYTKE